ncbi:MAG: vitamin B12 transporter [Candidatus Omnitrophota bacterium]|jgi:vitamin B12 transporter
MDIRWILLMPLVMQSYAEQTLPTTLLQATAPATNQSTLSTNSPLRTSFLTLDETLALQPGTRLFRRLDAVAAHPTTQGISLRNTGANAAGRTLVLRDGIPMNDPFGGWVPWTRWPALSLGAIHTSRDGGVSSDGWPTLGGTISLTPSEQNQVAFTTGSFVDYDAGLYASHDLSATTTLRTEVRTVDAPGYQLLPKGERGPVDTRAGFSLNSLSLRSDTRIGTRRLRISLDGFEEDRQNGTRLSRNTTEGYDLHVRLDTEHTRWSVYHQDRTFENVLTRVDDSRTSEQAVLDQYHVPGTAWGLVQRTQWERGPHTLQVGADTRWLDGATHERFRNLGDGFTREREAGGEQILAGLVAMDTWQGETWRLESNARLDLYRSENGHERVNAIAGGATIANEAFADQESIEPALRFTATRPIAVFTWHNAMFTGTRLPTLNEFYRPFRVGNDITVANEALEPERIYGLESGLHWRRDPDYQVRASVFYNRIDELVANVSQVEGPANVAPWGFIPAGGSGRQRENLDRAHTAGIECEGQWRINETLHVESAYLFTDSEVDHHPGLSGKTLVQTPAHQGTLLAWWKAHPHLHTGLLARGFSRVFEDDLNERELASAWTMDLLANWQLRPDLLIAVRINNLFDEAVATRKDGNGRIFTGAPRGFTASIQQRW